MEVKNKASAECGDVRDDRQGVARCESWIEGEYSRLCHDEPTDLLLYRFSQGIQLVLVIVLHRHRLARIRIAILA